MNKNNLMGLIVLLFIFSLLTAVPKVNSVLEEGAGFGSSIDEPSPAEITKPVEFPEGYLDLVNKEEKTFEDLEAIEGIEGENNLGYVEVGDVKIPLNTETHDGNIGGATAGTFELKGGFDGDLNPFKTLTSKSGKVLDVSRAEDIEKIVIKDGEIAEIVFSKIDESNENVNEVLYSSGEGKGLWFSPSKPAEGESEETNVQINEFGEGTIGIKAAAGINIEISGKENSEIIAKTDIEMNVGVIEEDSNYIEGTHLTIIKGGISVDGKEENLKITLLPNKEDEPDITIIEEHEDQIGMQLIEISSIGKELNEKNIYINCDEDKIGDDGDKIIYSFGDIKEGAEEATTQIDATQSSGVEITTVIEEGNEVTAKCEEDKTVKVSTWDIINIIKNAADKAISDINYFFKPGEYEVGGALGTESGEIGDIIESTKPQTTIYFPFTQPISSEGAGGGGAGVIDPSEEEETSEEAPEEAIKIDIEASGSIKASIESAIEGLQEIDKVTIEEGDKLDSILEEKPLPTLEEDIDEIIAALKEVNPNIVDGDSETFALWIEENKEWLVEEGLDLPSEELEAKYKDWVEQKSILNELAPLFEPNNKKIQEVEKSIVPVGDYQGGKFGTVPEENYKKGRDEDIKNIVLHTTGTNSETSALYTFTNPDEKVSSHIVIQQNGDIVQPVAFENTANAVGDTWSFEKNGEKYYVNNANSISIEVVGNENDENYELTQAQKESLVKVIVFLLDSYDLNFDDVVTHKEITKYPEGPNYRKVDGVKPYESLLAYYYCYSEGIC